MNGNGHNGKIPEGLMTKVVVPKQADLVTRQNPALTETPPSDYFPNFQVIADQIVRDCIRRLRADSQRINERIDAMEKLLTARPVNPRDPAVLNSFIELNIGPGDAVSGFIRHRAGKGSPESVITGSAGRDVWWRTDGAASTCLYYKESGEGNTGWVAAPSGSVVAPSIASFITTASEGSLPNERVATSTATITFTDGGAGTTASWDLASVIVSASHRLSLNVATPAQIVANTNNYNPGAGSFFRLTTDAARDITGIVAGADGDIIHLRNAGAFNFTLTNQDAASSAANRIITGTGGSVVYAPDDNAMLVYDITDARWILMF